MLAVGGNKPIAMLTPAISSSDATRAGRRPSRSASGPKTSAPAGRARNAEPNTANDDSRAAPGLEDGKKTLASTVARKP